MSAPSARRQAPVSPFAEAARAGLTATAKAMSPVWLYDAEGSALFEEITKLPEYYLTRTEISILRASAGEMVAEVSAGAALVEFGSGSSEKTPLVLAAMSAPCAYIPIDVSADALAGAAQRLRAQFPCLAIKPVVGDFTREAARIAAAIGEVPRLGFFPGSTLGNFDPPAAVSLLRTLRKALGSGARLLLGLDAPKSLDVLLPAYDDAAGVTARFAKNLLGRMNRELGADFDPGAFCYEARWNAERSCIEMHLISQRPQTVTVDGCAVDFAAGERLHVENSYKYSPEAFAALAAAAGWRIERSFSDPKAWFYVHRLLAA